MLYLWIHFFRRYKKSLFYFLAPFLAPYFFPKLDSISQLVAIFFPMGMVVRPLFVYFFGKMEKLRSLRLSLALNIIYVLLIPLIPSYSAIGFFSPLLFLTLKSLKACFAGPQTAAASLLLLEKQSAKEQGIKSATYEMFGVFGTFFAGLCVLLLLIFNVMFLWRLLYFLCAVSLYFVFKLPKTQSSVQKPQIEPLPFLSVIMTTGFSYATWFLCTHLVHVYMLHKNHNSILSLTMLLLVMALDALLLPLFGRLSKKIGITKQMQLATLFALCFSMPLFMLFNENVWASIFLVRCAIMVIGIMFAAPFYAYQAKLFPNKNAFYNIALGRSLGKEFIGLPTMSVCLMLQKVLPIWLAFGGYLAFMALITFALMYKVTLQPIKEQSKLQ